MKRPLLLTLSFLFISAGSFAQSMTFSHSPISPNDTLWATPDDTISFYYGGGGPHPMTSGHGSTASPVFFPTVTVNSSIPKATFTLDTIGTYLFHCGTNPGNTVNWGTIIIAQTADIEEQFKVAKIYPNPAKSDLYVKRPGLSGHRFEIMDIIGHVHFEGTFAADNNRLMIDELPSGMYFLRITGEHSSVQTFKKL